MAQKITNISRLESVDQDFKSLYYIIMKHVLNLESTYLP